jgi:hypothetical protein
MTPQEHPITPPLELVQQWLGTYFGTTVTGEMSGVELALATQAARWGADQELEACVEWLRARGNSYALALATSRRPKPPSLKEQALALVSHNFSDQPCLSEEGYAIIRKALEALPND